MGFQLSARDLARLRGVHPDLVKVVKRAAETSPTLKFFVIQGLRTVAEQKRNVARGTSTTMRSRHLTGHAVDLGVYKADGKTISWDMDAYEGLDNVMQRAAKDLNLTVEWGGGWRSFKDGPHWQLPWSKYP